MMASKPVSYFENRYRRKDTSYKRLAWTSVPAIEEGFLYAAARDISHHNVFKVVAGQRQELQKGQRDEV